MDAEAEVLLRMVVPGRDSVMSRFMMWQPLWKFCLQVGEEQKKGLRRKLSAFSVQMRIEIDHIK